MLAACIRSRAQRLRCRWTFEVLLREVSDGAVIDVLDAAAAPRRAAIAWS
jgi:hypothetical protein